MQSEPKVLGCDKENGADSEAAENCRKANESQRSTRPRSQRGTKYEVLAKTRKRGVVPEVLETCEPPQKKIANELSSTPNS
jgi:hypothetical protein